MLVLAGVYLLIGACACSSSRAVRAKLLQLKSKA